MPLQGASNEYSQHIFLWRNKKTINTFGLKKAPLVLRGFPNSSTNLNILTKLNGGMYIAKGIH